MILVNRLQAITEVQSSTKKTGYSPANPKGLQPESIKTTPRSDTLNILFINYGDQRTNSMGHIGPYANELIKRGHSCSVALDTYHPKQTGCDEVGLYEIYSHKEVASGWQIFQNGKSADIIHAWTPRESVRKLTLDYKEHHPDSKLIIHLEDNEESILESHYQTSIVELRSKSLAEPHFVWHPWVSHPIEYRRFLAIADAVTLITPSLIKLLPINKETIVITPIISEEANTKSRTSTNIREAHRIPLDTKIITFPGGITPSNREDIRSLYIAVHILQEKGIDIQIVKTGLTCPVFERSFQLDIKKIAIDLGFIDKTSVTDLLKISEVLVQPGYDNPFNRDRYPCKIPEFLRTGRPVIIPDFYIPPHIPEESICLGLKQSTPKEIADKIEILLTDTSLGQSIARNAQSYAKETFNAKTNGTRLERFYQETANRISTIGILAPPLPEELGYQNQRLSKECESLRNEIELAKTKLASQSLELERVNVQSNQIAQELIKWKERDKRRQESISWKITMPLRFIRRKLVDPSNPKATLATSPLPPEETESKTVSLETAEREVSTPPKDHRCYIKDYHKFVEREEWVRSIYLDKYEHPISGPDCPKISVILPVFNISETWLRKCIDSVISQVYQNWELCIADDASTEPHVSATLKEYQDKDPRIQIEFRPINGHISSASNSAFALATGDYIGLLDHDDELPPHALAKVVDSISKHPHAKLIYSDEDKIDDKEIRHDPHFKSDWNYDLFLGCNMVSHFGVYRRDAFEAAGGFRVGYEGAQDWDLALRVIEKCKESEIVHIPEVLYHWRTIESSTAHHHTAKNYAHEAQKRAISDHLERRGRKAELISIDGIHWRVRYKLPDKLPKVSIIIPTKDRFDLLSKCVDSILEKTTYENYEILIVDNQSSDSQTLEYLSQIQKNPSVRVLNYDSDFNYSAINNYAVSQSDAEVICLLNNDTEVITPGWLEELVSHTIRPEVGVVGAKLLYPDDHIQHTGIILGLNGVADCAFRSLYKDDYGHVHRANLTSRWSAVSGACMAITKNTWEQAKGFNEKDLPVFFADVDFCLRIKNLNLAVISSPYSILQHKESETLKNNNVSDTSINLHSQSIYMHKKWSEQIWRDPFYNPNFKKDGLAFRYLT